MGQRLVVATMLLNAGSNTKKVLHVSRAQVEAVYATLSSTLQLSPPPTVQLPPVNKLVSIFIVLMCIFKIFNVQHF